MVDVTEWKCRGRTINYDRYQGIGYGVDGEGAYIVTAGGKTQRVKWIERFISRDVRGNEVYEMDFLRDVTTDRDDARNIKIADMTDLTAIEEGVLVLL